MATTQFIGVFSPTYGPYQGGGGTVPITPAAPAVAYNSTTRQLSATHSLGGTIQYSYQGSAWLDYLGTIQVDDAQHAPGEWQFKRKASTGYNESPVANSPAIAAKPVTAPQDIHLIFDGNSIVANPLYPDQVVAKLRSALAARNDPRTVTYTVVATPGQSTQAMHDSAGDADAAYVAGKRNILLAWELFNQFRPPVLARTVTSASDVAAAVSAGVALFNDYCAARKAAHPDLVILAGSPTPDKFRGSDPAFNPPRADFYSAIQVPVLNQLQALLAAGTAYFDVLLDNTSDTAFDPADPIDSDDGVHPNAGGYVYSTNRALYGLLQVLFLEPQPAPVVAGQVYPNYVSGSTAAAYSGSTLSTSNGLVSGTGPGYGNTGLNQAYKRPAGTVAALISRFRPTCYNGIQGYSVSWRLTPYQEMACSFFWFDNNGVPGLAVRDGSNQRTYSPAVTGNTFAGLFVDAQNVFTLRISTDGGANWTVLDTLSFTTTVDLFPVLDIFGTSGVLAYPQWLGLTAFTAQVAVAGLLPGATRVPLSNPDGTIQTSAGFVVSRAPGSSGQALSGLKLPAGQDGWYAFALDNDAAADAALGALDSNVLSNLNAFKAAMYRGSGQFLAAMAVLDNGGLLTDKGVVTTGDFYRDRRSIADAKIYLERTRDGGVSWQPTYTYGYYSAGDLPIGANLTQDSAQIHHAQGVGLVPV